MKRSFPILMLMAATVLICGCSPEAEKKTNYGAAETSYFAVVAGLTDEVGTKTVFNLTVTGDVEKAYGYSAEVTADGVNLTVTDGGSEDFTEETVKAAATYYKDNSGEDKKFDGNMLDFVFSPPRLLFNLDSETVRSVTESKISGGTIYTYDLYEGKLTQAILCLQNEFDNIADVTDLSFKVTVTGTLVQIALTLEAVYTDGAEATLTVYVTHRATVKIID